MKKLVYLILIAAFLIRLIPVLGNHFYFTIDQGRDAVYVRDLLHGKFPLVGPQTDIEGVHHGVLWYYILAFCYAISFGSPFGAVIFLIILHILSIGMVSSYVKEEFGKTAGILIMIGLSILLPFYESSRYAFNPFLIGPILIVVLLYLSRPQRITILKSVLIGAGFGLSLHSELAVFIPLSIVLFCVLAIYKFKKLISVNQLTTAFLGWLVFLIPYIFSELTSIFSQFKSLQKHMSSQNGVFQIDFTKQIIETIKYFWDLLGSTIFPIFPFAGSLIFVIVFIFWFFKKRKELHMFPIIAVFILAVTIFWFSTNKGLRDWHVLYLPPVLFLGFSICLFSFKKIGYTIFGFILAAHFIFSGSRIISYMQNKTDSGFLNNQLAAINWVYEKSEDKGFYLYNYVPSVKDYHYQYLIYWYGKNKFGYLPCEYSTFPGTGADSYIPRAKNYQQPKKECDKDIYLIMDKAVDEGLKNSWRNEVTKNTQSLEKANFGEIEVERLILN